MGWTYYLRSWIDLHGVQRVLQSMLVKRARRADAFGFRGFRAHRRYLTYISSPIYLIIDLGILSRSNDKMIVWLGSVDLHPDLDAALRGDVIVCLAAEVKLRKDSKPVNR